MGKPNYAITRLSGVESLYLIIGEDKYEIAQMTMTFACNEIPRAQCMIAIGRSAKKARFFGKDAFAKIHSTAPNLKQMQKASIRFKPDGQYAPFDFKWPDEEVTIFDGYYVGSANRKANGKIIVIVNLIHWLVDLASTSALHANSHPSTPFQLTYAAVLKTLPGTGAGAASGTQVAAARGAYVSNMTGFQIAKDGVKRDLWGGIKRIFCGLANVSGLSTGQTIYCRSQGLGSVTNNTRAIRALGRMEGPAPDTCNKDYEYGVALTIDTGLNSIDDTVAAAITDATIESYSSTTLWDKLVNNYCPMFNMALVPQIDSAIVIADTPSYNGGLWKELKPEEYDSLDQDAALERPLRGVAVFGRFSSWTGIAGQVNAQDIPPIGGCYVAGSVDENDGVIQYVTPPSWLSTLINYSDEPAAKGLGVKTKKASPSATAPNVQKPNVDDPNSTGFSSRVNELFVKFAQAVYVANGLRGKVGSLSGKLRFDIAPGSCIKIAARGERFVASDDSLATDLFANVARVTININCEANLASTAFQVSHIRDTAENDSPRTSVSEHPLFGKKIHGAGRHGAPLIRIYDNLSD